MPKIPTYTPQRTVSGNLAPVTETPIRGRGLQRLGEAAGRATETLERGQARRDKEQKQADLYAMKAEEKAAETIRRSREQRELSDMQARASGLQSELGTELDQTLQSAEKGADVVQSFSQTLDERLADMVDNAETVKGRQYAERTAAKIRGQYMEKAARGQADLAGVWAVEDYSQAMTNWTSTLVGDPDSFDTVVDMHDDALEARDLSPKQRAKLRGDGRSALATSAIRGRIRDNALVAQNQLEDGQWDEYIDGDTKVQLLREAGRNIKQDDVTARANVALYLEDTLTSIQETGKDPGLLTKEDIQAAYPDNPKRADKVIDQIDSAKHYYGIKQDVALTTPEEDAERLAGMTGDIPGVNAVQAKNQRDDYMRAIQEKREALEDDPFAHVMSSSPELRQRYQNAENADEFRAVLHEADELQGDLGVPGHRRSFLGSQRASEITAEINNTDPETVADRMESMRQQYGPMWPQVQRELRSEGLDASYTVLARLDKPTDAVPRRKLASAAQTGRKTLRQNITSETANMVDDEVAGQLEDFRSTLQHNGRSGQQIFNAEKASAELLAYKYQQEGMSESEAAEQAVSDLITGRWDLEGTFRAPKGKGGQASSATWIRMRATPAEAFPPMADVPGAGRSDEQLREAARDWAMDGDWVNTPSGEGIQLLYPDGTPVVLEDGSEMSITWDELPLERSFDDAPGGDSMRGTRQ